MICREGVGSTDWRGDWKGTMVVGIGRGQGDIVMLMVLITCGCSGRW